MATSPLNLSVSIDRIDKVGSLVPHSIFNEYDQHGLLLHLPRLKAENNQDYRARLLDVNVHKANSTYLGLVYGITRELGLEVKNTLEVQFIADKDGKPIAKNPVIVFRGPYVDLYSDHENNVIEKTIDRYETTGAYTIGELVTEINKSKTFRVRTLDGINTYDRSMTLLNVGSIDLEAESLPVATQIQLKHKNIVSGSVKFSNTLIFVSEKTKLADVLKTGDFFINYKSGILNTFSPPSPGVAMSYSFIINPFIIPASPVIIHDLHKDFRDKMFIQNKDEFGNSHDGLPTELGADIINELLSVYPEYWGE